LLRGRAASAVARRASRCVSVASLVVVASLESVGRANRIALWRSVKAVTKFPFGPPRPWPRAGERRRATRGRGWAGRRRAEAAVLCGRSSKKAVPAKGALAAVNSEGSSWICGCPPQLGGRRRPARHAFPAAGAVAAVCGSVCCAACVLRRRDRGHRRGALRRRDCTPPASVPGFKRRSAFGRSLFLFRVSALGRGGGSRAAAQGQVGHRARVPLRGPPRPRAPRPGSRPGRGAKSSFFGRCGSVCTMETVRPPSSGGPEEARGFGVFWRVYKSGGPPERGPSSKMPRDGVFKEASRRRAPFEATLRGDSPKGPLERAARNGAVSKAFFGGIFRGPPS